jgi:DUF438 domain-containing protein
MNKPAAQDIKKQALKNIILDLHRGLSATEAKARFEQEVGNVTSGEIAEMEQELINEGLSPDEIKKFCNVHALIFQSALEKSTSQDTNPAHPVYLFKLENREIEKLLNILRNLIAERGTMAFDDFKIKLKELLLKIKEIEKHYTRKEQLLFPFLEKQGFTGPSKVMWAKDNEIREFMRAAFTDLEEITGPEEMDKYIQNDLDPLTSEVGGMITKEEGILFPTSLEKLKTEDWIDILRESDDIGYVFIRKPEEVTILSKSLESAVCEEPVYGENLISFPSGSLKLSDLMYLLNTLPVDITLVDKEDTVRYFSENKVRVFARPRAIVGRKVQNCHPPQSLAVVEKILTSFKEGTRDSYDFRIHLQGKYVHIAYYALRDKDSNYLGTLEVTQDITRINGLTGEKRLIDEKF